MKIYLRADLLAASLVLVVAACSNVPASDGALTADEEEYLESVASVESDFTAAVADFNDALGRVYNVREAVFTAVGEAGFEETVEAAVTQARSLTPPDSFEEDHEIWLDYWSTVSDLDLEAALGSRDLHQVLEIFTESEQAFGKMLMEVSRDLCLAAAQRGPDLCPAGPDLVGGEYGKAAHEALRDYQLSSLGLFIFPPDMSPEERSLRLDQVQPQIEEALRSAGEALSELDPPPEFEDDHAAYLRFFDEQHATAVAITEANEAGDMSRVLELFAQSNVVFNQLVEALSPEFEPIAAPFFAGEVGEDSE